MIYQPLCPKCGEKYPPASLRIFMKTGQKFCPKCDKEKFSRENSSRPNLSDKTKKPVACNRCGKKIYFSNNEYCMYSYAPCGHINERFNIKILKNYSIIYMLSD